jgi:hypothetical protein
LGGRKFPTFFALHPQSSQAQDRGVKRSDSITHHGAGRRSNFFSFYELRDASLDIDAMVKWFGEDAALV